MWGGGVCLLPTPEENHDIVHSCFRFLSCRVQGLFPVSLRCLCVGHTELSFSLTVLPTALFLLLFQLWTRRAPLHTQKWVSAWCLYKCSLFPTISFIFHFRFLQRLPHSHSLRYFHCHRPLLHWHWCVLWYRLQRSHSCQFNSPWCFPRSSRMVCKHTNTTLLINFDLHFYF